MRLRHRFLALYAGQAILTAAFSVVVAFSSFDAAEDRARAELGAEPPIPAAALDATRSAEARLGAALADEQDLRARSAAARLFRAQAALEAAVGIGGLSLAWAGLAALVFAVSSRGFTRRLDELALGAREASRDRAFRFGATRDREFGPVFAAFDATLDELAERERRLEEAARLDGWREVSSFLFHQLKTPLSSIELAVRNLGLAAERCSAAPSSLAAELASRGGSAERGGDLAASCAESSARAAEECLRVRILLDRFKSLAGLSLEAPETCRLGDLVAGLAARLPPFRAEFECPSPEAAVRADRRMLEEALLNLAQNAAEACARPPARVRFEAERRGGLVELLVSDGNGPVDPSLLERAGRGRFSTKPEGTGLGLLFVRRVAALHGGSFEAFAGPEGGFRVRLTLPAAEIEGRREP